jgi:hypothetical protein
MLRNLLLLLSTAVGGIMAVDGRFLDLSTNAVVHVEAILVTTLITTARVYKRQTQQALPSACYQDCSKCIIPRSHCLHSARLANQYMSGTDEALQVAEQGGENPAICPPGSHFSIAFLLCEGCLSAHPTDAKTVAGNLIASLNVFLSYCNDRSALASFSSLLNIEASVSSIQASLCSVNNITSDCPTTSSRNVTVATISPKPSAVSTSVTASSAAVSTPVTASSAAVSTPVAASSAATSYSVASTSPLKSAGAIAGVAVACTLAAVFIIALVIFLYFRRRKRHKQDKIRKAETADRQEEEKAQLHSEDLKPIRQELSGDQPLASKKDVPIAEVPANEAVGSELPGESSEERNEEEGSSNTVCQSN